MQRINGNPFATGALQFPAGRYVAFAIAPESEFDQVLVDGKLLAAGRVLQHVTEQPKITPVRGPRAKPSTAFASATYEAVVIGYECGDVIVPPGPRAPRIYRKVLAAPAGVTVLRAPFVGRRAGRVLITRTGDDSAVEWYLAGLQHTGNETTPITVAYLVGSPADPALVAAAEEDESLELPLGSGINFGGTNDAELADELALVLNVDGMVDIGLIVEIEVLGEEGLS